MAGSPLSLILTIVIAALALTPPAVAGNGKFDLGLRGNIVGGSGKPTNDILGVGLFGHYRLNGRWRVGFSLDHSPEFDVERAPDLVGLRSPDVIDAIGTSTAFSGWIERVHPRAGGKWEFFWGAGLGINTVDVDPLAGPLAGGGIFDITTDAGTEFLAKLTAGARRWFAGSWGLEAALRGDQHFADWTMIDRVSGATGTISDYFVKGIGLGFLKKF